MKRYNLRMEDSLYEKVKNKAEELGNKSINDVIVEAIKQYLKGRQVVIENLPRAKIIVTKYDTECMLCKNTVSRNERVLWFRGFGVVCTKCLLSNVSEKLLDTDKNKKYIKLLAELKKLETLRKEAKQYLDDLLVKIATLEETIKVYELKRQVKELLTMVNDYYFFTLSGKIDNKEFISKMNEVLNKLNEVLEALEKHEITIPEKWKKQIIKIKK